MEIIKLYPYGFCKGVNDAITKIKEIAKNNPTQNIFCLGQIAHNDIVNQQLADLHIKVLLGDKENNIDNINEGIVIFSAHGTSQKVIDKAQNKGLQVIDTICPIVKKSMDNILKKIKLGYEIIYIGVVNHPETIACLSISNKIHLVTSIEDIDKLKIVSDRIFVSNQTTLSINSLFNIYNHIIECFPLALIEDEICNQTRIRQDSINHLDSDFDGLIIVGDNKSNNTKALLSNARNKKIDSILVDCYDSINKQWLKGKKKIAITSGTSTPNFLVDDIVNKLKSI